MTDPTRPPPKASNAPRGGVLRLLVKLLVFVLPVLAFVVWQIVSVSRELDSDDNNGG